MKLILAGAAALFSASNAHAVINTYDSLADLQAASTLLILEDFEDVSFQLAERVSADNFDVAETVGAPNEVALGPIGVLDFGLVSGTDNVGYNDNGRSVGVFDSFSGSFTALGFWYATSEDSVVRLSVNGSEVAVLDASATPAFFGLTTMSPLVTVAFDVSGSPFVAFDDVYLGSAAPVPVPAAAPLMLAGLAALGLRKKRKS
ncbi:MAG: VPLPA-CTERM sorting domain-containing protein [Parvularculaceae bacterium]|nr:VPLPA-CTERM sorting domain-containing protein [Parvularculaceae bacterium]